MVKINHKIAEFLAGLVQREASAKLALRDVSCSLSPAESSRFEMKVQDRIFWVTVEEGF